MLLDGLLNKTTDKKAKPDAENSFADQYGACLAIMDELENKDK